MFADRSTGTDSSMRFTITQNDENGTARLLMLKAAASKLSAAATKAPKRVSSLLAPLRYSSTSQRSSGTVRQPSPPTMTGSMLAMAVMATTRSRLESETYGST